MRASKTAVDRPRRRHLAALTAAAIALSAVASPAAAHDNPLPTDPADWPSAYSPLPAREVAPKSDIEFDFDGKDAGLHDATGIHTGFTLVQPASAKTQTYYLPANLSVTGGLLKVTATNGTAFGTAETEDDPSNSQDNTLGVVLDVDERIIRLQATVVNPTGIHDSAQAGLWFGPDDENYLKLAFVGSGTSSDDKPRQLQLKREIGGGDQTDAGSQIILDIKNAYVAAPVESAVHLTLDIDPVALTATGTYQFGESAPLPVGTVSIPQKWLTSQVQGAPVGVQAIGGIFTAAGDMASSPTFSFESFSASDVTAR